MFLLPALLLLLVTPGEGLTTASAYFGTAPPGAQPELFAEGLVSTPEEYEFGSVFSEDGLEFFYGVDLGGRSEIRTIPFADGAWGQPELLLSDSHFSYNDPFLSPGEERLYFISNRSVDGSTAPKDSDIWFIERTGAGWLEPARASGGVNSEADEYYMSFTDDGAIFFASNRDALDERRRDFDIYSAPWIGDGFGEAVRLEGGVNAESYDADVFVAPDASYLIFSSVRREGLGQGDLYVSFRAEDGTWLEAESLGPPINTQHHELCPFVSRDGRFLFYTSDRDIYWIELAQVAAFRDRTEP